MKYVCAKCGRSYWFINSLKCHIRLKHYPANSGNYLKRNIEMVDACDEWFNPFKQEYRPVGLGGDGLNDFDDDGRARGIVIQKRKK